MEGHRRPQPIRSSFSDDPEMRELVDYFLGDLTRRVESLRAALDEDDAHALRRLAHQLAGAAAGYGFAEIGEAARVLDDALHENADQNADEHADGRGDGGIDDGLAREIAVSDARERAEELIRLCRRAIRPVAGEGGTP